MKKYHAVAFAGLAALLAALPVSASTKKAAVIAFNADRDLSTEPLFGRGTPARQVLDALGLPSLRLSRDVWVYWNYQTNSRELSDRGLDTLVIAFADNRVSGLKIVPRASIDVLVARADARPPADALAMK